MLGTRGECLGTSMAVSGVCWAPAPSLQFASELQSKRRPGKFLPMPRHPSQDSIDIQEMIWDAAFPSFVLEEKCVIHVLQSRSCMRGPRSV